MTDATDGKTDMPQKPLRLNPEALAKVAPADQKAFERVEAKLERAPWYKRLAEGVLHHLAGELAGIAIGAGLVLGNVVGSDGPKSFPPQMLDKICIVQLAAPRGDGQRTFRLVPCPPADDITQTRSTGDGSG